MSTIDFIARLVGLFVFALLGAQLGVEVSPSMDLSEDAVALIFGLVGALFGLIITPLITVRPVQLANRSIREMPIEVFAMMLAGGFIGLLLALLLAYPLSFLPKPISNYAAPISAVILAYLGLSIFRVRARELWETFGGAGGARGRMLSMQSTRQLLVDTSVLIDGRIVEIAKTGFLGGTLLIPRFVMSELHQVADSSDQMRRKRGRRGLLKVSELQRNDVTPVKMIDDDVEGISEVDDKLVALAIQKDAYLITNDYPLAKVAESQGVTVLNINLLSNVVRAVYIPGESFMLNIFQEGTDPEQGVGYLDDGTMVVVEDGRGYMGETIEVEVTRLINRPAGRIIFAVAKRD